MGIVYFDCMNYYHDWFQFIAQDFSKTDSHMLFPKIACVESGNLKTPDSDEKWSNRSLEKSMANWRTQLIQNVGPLEHRATPPPSRAGVYCTTACERDAAANLLYVDFCQGCCCKDLTSPAMHLHSHPV